MLHHRFTRPLWTLVVMFVLAFGGFRPSRAQSPVKAQGGNAALAPVVRYANRHDTSAPLRVLAANAPAVPQSADGAALRERRILPKAQNRLSGVSNPDPAVQRVPVTGKSPAAEFNFEGVNNINGVLPPDTNGDIGPNHYMQWVNLSLSVWSLDRNTNTATQVLGPASGNSIWSGFGGPCETTNDGDPIVLYDHLADRWMISQFALPNYPNGPYYQCIAVSQTGDPTGAWHRYEFTASTSKMNDYPHFGVWPDGYYMTANQFTNGSSWGGAGVFVFERNQMLAGQTARMVYFDLYNVDSDFGGMLPSDLDGDPPPAGTPNYFAEVDDSSWLGDPNDTMRIWEFHVDWSNTSNSTFGVNGQPNYTLTVDDFAPIGFNIPQPDTSQQLDNLGDRLMYRLQFRNFGSYFTLVTNHTVNAGSVAGVRWYELHKPTGGAWSMYQQGTYAGDSSDGIHRWMASAALDSAGNLAIGYSASNSSVYPSIRYTGRLVNDPLGTLPQGEAELLAGSGSQTHSAGRWGDYSMLSVDPTNQCTFWFTTEYVQNTGSAPWQTRIGSFTFPSCLSGLKGDLGGRVAKSGSGDPIEGAQVDADGYTGLTDSRGRYMLEGLPVGTYTVTVSAYGYYSQTVTDVEVFYGQVTTQDFALTEHTPLTLTGTVRDGSGQGWPLYARINVSAPGYADTLYTNPADGSYSLSLYRGITYTLDVSAPGYVSQSAQFSGTHSVETRDFVLLADSDCSAPGYTGSGTCTPQSGGLLHGNVYNRNTGTPVNGAQVSHGSESALTAATPEDPARDDGFYTLFVSGSGAQEVSATGSGYPVITETVTITPGSVGWQNFSLPAGRLAFSPPGTSVTLIPTPTLTRTVLLSNTGSYTFTFTLGTVDAPAPVLSADGPFAPATRRASPKHMTDYDARAVYLFTPPAAGALPAGDGLAAWDAGTNRLWGLGFDPQSGLLWTGDAADLRVAAFSAEGQPAGKAFEAASLNGVFPAGMTYDPFRQVFWLLNVGGDDCLHAFDPDAGFTGESICPRTDNALHGVAFDPRSGTFYAGSWNDSIVYQFTSEGLILRSVATGLNIAGMAFNPATGHLFIANNAAEGFDVYVLDADNAFALLGGFDVDGLDAWEQAGIALDCSGALYLADQDANRVYQVVSGEEGVCAWQTVPWLEVAPSGGELAPGAAMPVVLTFKAAGVAAGTHSAHLKVVSDTPQGGANIPVSLKVNPYYALDAALVPPAQETAAGSQVSYTVTVTNTGNLAEVYDIVISNASWNTHAPLVIGYLDAGQTGSFQVTVDVPASAHPGAGDRADITLTARHDTAQTRTLSAATRVSGYSLFLPVLRR